MKRRRLKGGGTLLELSREVKLPFLEGDKQGSNKREEVITGVKSMDRNIVQGNTEV